MFLLRRSSMGPIRFCVNQPGGADGVQGPQSAQSVPRSHKTVAALGDGSGNWILPSSQTPSFALKQVLEQIGPFPTPRRFET
mmetsp:Transcript_5720/g.12638  ORF Transcript_5720/g.12638 Transcript_5720/m.12638 type:complete len:82 (-) Transcript_5720:373-618(-)